MPDRAERLLGTCTVAVGDGLLQLGHGSGQRGRLGIAVGDHRRTLTGPADTATGARASLTSVFRPERRKAGPCSPSITGSPFPGRLRKGVGFGDPAGVQDEPPSAVAQVDENHGPPGPTRLPGRRGQRVCPRPSPHGSRGPCRAGTELTRGGIGPRGRRFASPAADWSLALARARWRTSRSCREPLPATGVSVRTHARKEACPGRPAYRRPPSHLSPVRARTVARAGRGVRLGLVKVEVSPA